MICCLAVDVSRGLHLHFTALGIVSHMGGAEDAYQLKTTLQDIFREFWKRQEKVTSRLVKGLGDRFQEISKGKRKGHRSPNKNFKKPWRSLPRSS